jgi:hypothetical protein
MTPALSDIRMWTVRGWHGSLKADGVGNCAAHCQRWEEWGWNKSFVVVGEKRSPEFDHIV